MNKYNPQNNDEKGLLIHPIGGLGEIGKNCLALEEEGELLILDCGLGFPDDSQHGVDIIVPDFTMLVERKDRIKALLLTHGHEDHIGAVTHLLEQIPGIPIYGTPLTLGLLDNKLRERGLSTEMHRVKYRTDFSVGHFTIRYMHVTHSLADCAGIAIRTNQGMVVHTGDFKIDHTPIDGVPFDFGEFARLGNEGVKLLLSDSTNVEKKTCSTSEQDLYDVFHREIRDVPSRIYIAMFSSNIQRVQQVLDIAASLGKFVTTIGSSMIRNFTTARDLGYLSVPSGIMISPKKAGTIDRKKTIFLITGTQGEPMAALSRLARKESPDLDIKKGDTVLVSASSIPGNEKVISRLLNRLYLLGAAMVHRPLIEVHSSGHATAPDLKLMFGLTRPEYFVPVHGEYRFLKQHAALAASLGMDKKNKIKVLRDGDMLMLDENGFRMLKPKPTYDVFISNAQPEPVDWRLIKERQKLSSNGLIICHIVLSGKGSALKADIYTTSRGFLNADRIALLFDTAEKRLHNLIHDMKDTFNGDITQEEGEKFIASIEHESRSLLRDACHQLNTSVPSIFVRAVHI